MRKVTAAIPMGDPAGIGPEIVLRAAASPEVFSLINCIVIGDRKILELAEGIVHSGWKLHCIASAAEADFSEGILNMIDLDLVDPAAFAFGRVSGMCGQAACAFIEKSIQLALDGEADVVVTPPINKESLRAGEIPYIGHTEIFAALTNTEDPLTMFETGGLRIFFLTRHVPLRQVPELITKERVKDYVRRCTEALKSLGVQGETLAVAGLNPHSGEHGLFGREEMDAIIPAVKELRREGYPVTGPIGADSVFYQARQGKYAAVLSLYHDQGHIAAKTLDFERTISLTLGMPVLRTSVDHGTAFDIAGTGKASPVSMMEALRLAAKYAPGFTGPR